MNHDRGNSSIVARMGNNEQASDVARKWKKHKCGNKRQIINNTYKPEIQNLFALHKAYIVCMCMHKKLRASDCTSGCRREMNT